MGNNKPNAYSLFVRDEFRRRQKAGEQVNFGSLFKQCDPQWRNLPEDVRQKYKDRAKSGGDSTPSFSQSPVSAQTGSTASPMAAINTTNNVKINSSPTKFNINAKPNDDVKPVIKTEQGVKRNLELETLKMEQERDNKRAKLGYAVPNWKNIKNSTHPDADRYLDYHLVKIRNNCESIVSSRGQRIITIPIYTFSVNVLCKYKKDEKDIFIPIEFGIYCYSIEEGAIGKPYHVLIDAGPVPTGCYNISKDHANNHKICFNSNGGYPTQARNDYKKIYREMVKYTKAGERTILIADERDLAQVQGSIEWLYEKASAFDKDVPKPSTWTIMPLVEYVALSSNFINMHVLHRPKPFFTLHYYLKMMLEQSIWDYDDTLMCPYHVPEKNQTKWCAKSCAVRAIRCIETHLEAIYKMYKVATAPPPPQQQPNAPGPQTLTVPLDGGAQPGTKSNLCQPQVATEPRQESTMSNITDQNGRPLAIEAPPAPVSAQDPRIRRRLDEN